MIGEDIQRGNGILDGFEVGGKYELISCKHTPRSGQYRIRALKDVNDNVKKGTIGGYVDSENVLSPEGECWIFDDSLAVQGSVITGNASVSGRSHVRGSTVQDDAFIVQGSVVRNGSIIKDRGAITNSAVIDNSTVGGDSVVGGADVTGSTLDDICYAGPTAFLAGAKITGDARVFCRVVNATIGGEGVELHNPELQIEECTITSMKQFMVLQNPYGNSSCWPAVYQDGKVFFKSSRTKEGKVVTDDIDHALRYIDALFQPTNEVQGEEKEHVMVLFRNYYENARNYLMHVNSTNDVLVDNFD